MEFVHLHLHSEYSLLDGACRVADIPRAAKAAGHTAVALTDHGNLFGAVAFYRACMAEGIKPILGCEMYFTPSGRMEKERENYHLILLVKDEIGYKNLCYLSSKSYIEGFHSKPRIDLELLSAHCEGLVCLSACIGGYIPQLILAGRYEEARDHAKTLKALFGEDFYLELQSHGLQEEQPAMAGLLRLADELSLPLALTNDVHYLRRRDADAQAILMCIQTNNVIADGRPMGFETDEFYYKSTAEMAELFPAHPEALANTVRIAEKCNFTYTFGETFLPEFAVPEGHTTASYLRACTMAGLERRIAQGDLVFTEKYTREQYLDRAEYELGVIVSMGYDGYFLIVQDFVQYAKKQGIPVGPGRGSGAGSLVAYLLGITDVDSIRYDLLFERFLNPERVSMPDFDIDFCYERRGEVIRYVTEKYGAEHVSQIATFGTMAARAVVRDVGRALGMPYAEVDAIAKLIPRELGVTLQSAIDKNKELKEIYEAGGSKARLLDTALLLEGMPRHASTHAAGVVITPKPLYEYVPLSAGPRPKGKEETAIVTQFDMDTVAALGLLKFDFLGLRYLTIIEHTRAMIAQKEPAFSLSQIPTQDSATFDLLCSGHTAGIFQLESAGMRKMLIEFRPRNIEDIMLAIALYRPGPMDSIPKLIANRRDPAAVRYALPELAEILDSSYGCIVYQEQVMQICRRIAGYTFGRADSVRRAMAKKKVAVMEQEREAFLAGAAERHIPAGVANALFDDMASFAHYAFNKSHAAAYAIVAYQTAYLKCHYPKEYMAALLTSVRENPDKTAAYIVEANQLGITVSPPDINRSEMKYIADTESIRFGLLAIKNVGQSFVDAILAERRARPFASFFDFVERMAGQELNKLQVEALIKAGCFDSFSDTHRAQLLASYTDIVERMTSRSRDQIAGQLDLFSMLGDEAPAFTYEYPEITPLSAKEKLLLERESTGFYFSGHLLDDYRAHIESMTVTPISDICASFDEEGEANGAFADKQVVTVAGIIKRRQNKQTRKGDPMAFALLEDRAGEMELVVFPKVLETCAAWLTVDRAVYVTGELSVREDGKPSLLVRTLAPLQANGQPVTQAEQATEPQRTTPARGMHFGPAAAQPTQGMHFGPSGAKPAGGVHFGPTAAQPVQGMHFGPDGAGSPRGMHFGPPVAQPPQPPQAVRSKSATPAADAVPAVKKLYLRMPSESAPEAQRARALVGIFEGAVPVFFYYTDTKQYVPAPMGIEVNDFLLDQLRDLLGEENVVCK